jgi:hypothetical protein
MDPRRATDELLRIVALDPDLLDRLHEVVVLDVAHGRQVAL